MKIYPEAEQILGKIKEAGKILLSLHISPDPDSVGSNLALSSILEQMGKNVAIVSPDPIAGNLSFLPGLDKIIHQDIAYMKQFDLLIILDAVGLDRISKNENITYNGSIIVIDHHQTNKEIGLINLVDKEASATSEVLYFLFKQWGYSLTPEIATCLLTGIIGDTGNFKYAVTGETMKVVSSLIESGAKIDEINFHLSRSIPVATLRFWGRILSEIQVREAGDKKFVWTAVPFEVYTKEKGYTDISEFASLFLSSVAGCDFGLLVIQDEPARLKCSLRARTDIDVSRIAQLFGGGGHKTASGFAIKIQGSLGKTLDFLLLKIESYLENMTMVS